MNMPKSRDIQAKIPLPQAIWNNFGYVTVNGVNSNVNLHYLTNICKLTFYFFQHILTVAKECDEIP